MRRIGWGALGAGLFLPAAIGAFFPTLIYDNYFTFLVWVSLAPLCAVYFVDFFLLRRRRLNLRSLYEGRFRSRYGFWRGFNPASFIAVAVDSLTYYLLLNPLTYEQAYVFRFVSASIPAFFAAALAHVLLTKLLVQSLGKGGYETATEKEAAKDTEIEEAERYRQPR